MIHPTTCCYFARRSFQIDHFGLRAVFSVFCYELNNFISGAGAERVFVLFLILYSLNLYLYLVSELSQPLLTALYLCGHFDSPSLSNAGQEFVLHLQEHKLEHGKENNCTRVYFKRIKNYIYKLSTFWPLIMLPSCFFSTKFKNSSNVYLNHYLEYNKLAKMCFIRITAVFRKLSIAKHLLKILNEHR